MRIRTVATTNAVEDNEQNSKAIVAFNAALTHEKADTVILCDVSLSMEAMLPASGARMLRRIDALKQVLLRTVSKIDHAAVILFGRTAKKLNSWDSFDATRYACGGSTNLEGAFFKAKAMNPSHIIVITDGEPNREQEALDEARSMLCKVDVYYCGPGVPSSVTFCNELAQYGGQAVIDPECINMLDTVTLFLCDTIAA